jgi:hypothetical protein
MACLEEILRRLEAVEAELQRIVALESQTGRACDTADLFRLERSIGEVVSEITRPAAATVASRLDSGHFAGGHETGSGAEDALSPSPSSAARGVVG